jgi:hypothetical protein
LADLVSAALSAIEPEQEHLIVRHAGHNAFPLSFAQERVWFLDRLDPGKNLYNIPVILRLAGRLKVRALEQSVLDLTLRHEVLRTRYAMQDGHPMQKVEQVEQEKRQRWRRCRERPGAALIWRRGRCSGLRCFGLGSKTMFCC